MWEKIILTAVLLSPAVIVAVLVYKVSYFATQRYGSKKAASPVAVAAPIASAPEYVPQSLVVRDIEDGKGTVIMRYRNRKHVVTAHLIVWAGESKRKKKFRHEDSYYDLGFFDAKEVTFEIIAKATSEARYKLAELARPRPRRAAAQAAEVVAEVVQQVATVQAEVATPAPVERSSGAQTVVEQTVVSAAAAVEVEDNGEHQPAIKLKKTPAVFRGVILESGPMRRALQDKVITSFGVKYRTPEGIEDAVWGVDLQRAMASANVTVGDTVEILKIGRKTIEKGKAPMNLYQIAKIGAANPVA